MNIKNNKNFILILNVLIMHFQLPIICLLFSFCRTMKMFLIFSLVGTGETSQQLGVCKGPGFGSWNLSGGSHLHTTAVLGDLKPLAFVGAYTRVHIPI